MDVDPSDPRALSKSVCVGIPPVNPASRSRADRSPVKALHWWRIEAIVPARSFGGAPARDVARSARDPDRRMPDARCAWDRHGAPY